MFTLFVLASIAAAVLFGFAVLAVVGFLLKIVFWIIFFPIRLVLRLVFGVVGAVIAVALLPLILLVGAVAIVGAILAALFAIIAPLLPLAFVVLIGWVIYRASTRRPSPVL
jgi:hypothetical protein